MQLLSHSDLTSIDKKYISMIGPLGKIKILILFNFVYATIKYSYVRTNVSGICFIRPKKHGQTEQQQANILSCKQ